MVDFRLFNPHVTAAKVICSCKNVWLGQQFWNFYSNQSTMIASKNCRSGEPSDNVSTLFHTLKGLLVITHSETSSFPN